MPAINVARTDTFEQQRVKINDIGTQLFNIAEGGSDLSTGILKLGDGSIPAPSLAFTNDEDLGLYKVEIGTLGIVSGGKKLADFTPTGYKTYGDSFVQKNFITSGDISITNAGSLYEAGSYDNIFLTGGTGRNAEATILVLAFVGSVTNIGAGMNQGSFTNVNMLGGSGSGTTASFNVAGIEGSITNNGSGYEDGSYNNVGLTGGTGSDAVATVVVDQGLVTQITIESSGTGYQNGQNLGIDNSDMEYTDENDVVQTSGGSGAVFTISNNPGSVIETTFDFNTRGNGYAVGNVLTLPTTYTFTATITEEEGNPVSQINITATDAANLVEGSDITATGTGSLEASTQIGTIAFDAETNQWSIALSATPTAAGSATFTSVPPYGNQTTPFNYTIASLGAIDTVTITNGGVGYFEGDTLGVNPADLVQDIVYTVTSIDGVKLAFNANLGTITTSNTIRSYGGAAEDATVATPGTGGTEGTVTGVAFSGGAGSGAVADVDIDENGDVSSLSFTSGGYGYAVGNNLTANVPGTSGTTTISISQVSDAGADQIIYEVLDDGSQITGVICVNDNFQVGQVLRTDTSTLPITPTAADSNLKFLLNDAYIPSLTLYVGNTYVFNYEGSHVFALSQFRDGQYAPSLIENVTATLSAGNTIIAVSSSAGIQVGMQPVYSSGTDGIPAGTTVVSIPNGSSVELSTAPTSSGSAILDFSGVEYTQGATRTGNSLEFKVTETTATPLYYYCSVHPNMGGEDNNEAVITIDANNPRVFGSGAVITADTVQTLNLIATDVATDLVTIPTLTSTTINATTINVAPTGKLTAATIDGANVNASTIATLPAAPNLTITATGDLTLGGANILINDDITIDTNGNLDSTGYIKTTTNIEVGEKTRISGNVISSLNGEELTLTPDATTNQNVRISAATSIIIPSGDSAARPIFTTPSDGDGSIRFNTETNQYEGYSGTNQSWSSLGGVRDLDGNTYILAEQTVGANDNTLWFYNNAVNTMKFSPFHMEFQSVKKMRSNNVAAPAYVPWTANTPVLVGAFLKYKNDIYEVMVAGVTATSGSEPTDTSGNNFSNNTATLRWVYTAVDAITVEETSEFRIDPLGITDFVVNGELRMSNNVISTDVNDLVIQPNSGKRVEINATSTFVLPVGGTTDRGAEAQGAIRFNSTDNQFEGYDGNNWGSLGGVKDVDQNTYIIPETAPGANENVLFFYNDGNNTMQLTTTALDFYTVDTIRSVTSDELEITASLLTIDNADTTLDNTVADTTFLHSSKAKFDIGISAGITTDPVIRLTSDGDVLFNNTGFGTGNYSGLTLLKNDLKTFELEDCIIKSEDYSLIKGTTDQGNSVIYSSVTSCAAKTTICAINTNSGDREFIEFAMTDNGTDVYHTEYGNLRTGIKLFDATVEYVPATNEVRINTVLDSGVPATNTISFTFVSQVTKK